MNHPDGPTTDSTRLRASDLVPLAAFLVPTIAIGYGVVIPKSCIAGVNSLTIGFALTLVSACITYLVGVRAARRR